MDRRTLTKLLTVTALVLVYVVVAALDFHREFIAPIVVLAVAATLFLPIRRGGAGKRPRDRRPEAAADEIGSRGR